MNDPEQKQRLIIFATTMILAGTIMAACWNAIERKWPNLFGAWMPVAFAICVAATKITFPKIPGYQLAPLGIILTLAHYFLEHYGPLSMMVSELVMQTICTALFGAFWVRRGYMSKDANNWEPEGD